MSPRRDRPSKRGYPRLTRPRGGETKRRRVEEYLASLDPGQLGVTTASSIVAAFAAQGMAIEEGYAGRILSEWRLDHGIPTPGERWR